MNKEEFIRELREGLNGIPEAEREESIRFYSEMIDDMTEEGISEEEAISRIGSAGDIADQIRREYPKSPIKEKKEGKSKGMSPIAIVLLILGFPVWFPLIMAAISVLLSVYVVIWAVLISLWSVFASLVGASLGILISGLILMILGSLSGGAFAIGAGVFCAGLSIVLFFGCTAASVGVIMLTAKITRGIIRCFKREARA